MSMDSIWDWMVKIAQDVHEKCPTALSATVRDKTIETIRRFERVRAEEVARLNELADENATLRDALTAATNRARVAEDALQTERYKALRAQRMA